MGTLEENLKLAVPEVESLQKKVEEEPSAPEKRKKNGSFLFQIRHQVLTAIAVSWVSMIIGYSTAYTSPAQKSLETTFDIANSTQMSWITSFMPLGALAGGCMGGPMIDYVGRKWTILFTNVLFLGSWSINYFAKSYQYLYVSRILTGISVGVASLTLPVYLGETLQPDVRGSLGLLPTAFGNIGIMVCYLFGIEFEWQALALVGIILSLPFLAFIWFIPETPRSLISKGKEEQSKKSLQWFRGATADIDNEFVELKKNQTESDEKNESILALFNAKNLKPIGIALGLMFFQQFSGINAVISYTTKIFEATGSNLNNSVCTMIVGVVNFISTFIASVLIDKLGRKLLLYISSVSMIVSLGVLGTYYFLKNYEILDMSSFALLPLVSFMVYVLGFSLGFGPIPWLMMGEILPAKVKESAASISTAFNWSCTFVITSTFLQIIEAIGIHYTFWMFGFIMMVALAFTILFVPETKGQSLADIERKLAGVKVRRTSSVDNLKPMPSAL